MNWPKKKKQREEAALRQRARIRAARALVPKVSRQEEMRGWPWGHLEKR